MTCNEAKVSEYLDNEMPSGERAAFEEHLQTCAECAGLLARFDHMRQAFRAVATPGDIHGKVATAMRREFRARSTRPLRKMALVAAAAFIVYVGVASGLYARYRDAAQTGSKDEPVRPVIAMTPVNPEVEDVDGTSKAAPMPKDGTPENSTSLDVPKPPPVAPMMEAAAPKVTAPENTAMARDTMIALNLTLPNPSFGSGPFDYINPAHLEERSFKPREPLMVPGDCVLLSQGRPVTSSAAPVYGDLSAITDGEKGYQQECVTELPAGTQWVQIDLEAESEIYAIACWHFHAGDRVYFDVIVQVADDAKFTQNVRTLFNNDYDDSSYLGTGTNKEYIESYEGKLLSTLQNGIGPVARYVRLYSNGSTTDDTNHYIEVEVWGAPTTDNPVTGQ